ncbi:MULTISPECIES: phosphotransferase [unclassified Streptomyces]|uniref:phosphotransferase n=1 Tax=unclassified Streptomyces TaxID=2593676 RepID=UPI00225ABD99|nr:MULTISPECIES: aminoglycoside phosphotransferase family protein [unclassified Streptomyces]MCX5047822.1 aminoglycoside phosphotransferase family protein [Streptomyces sp. NBC_00474]MCX5245650.1 aminoglycoside phosphotransferase family protein [Streptomyces sp. NBC_00201]
MRITGRVLGSGRANDVYEIDRSWVLRRNREGWGDAVAEGVVMDHVRAHGYPVPRVRLSDSTRTELVMERLSGPTMLEACLAGLMGADEAGDVLARLLRQLHALPARERAGRRVLHLDLHPDNVMLTPDGPHVIDWTNAEEGHPGLDWSMSAVILAQVAVGDDRTAALARTVLTALLADPSQLTEDGLAEARRRRAANLTMSRREVQLLGEAEELIRSYRS